MGPRRRLPRIAGVALGFAVLLFAAGAAAAGERTGEWRDFQIIIWQAETSAGYDALKSIGVSAAALTPDRDHPQRIPPQSLASLLQSHLPWYVENIATDFYSPYHRWFPDHAVNWRFVEVQHRYAQNSADGFALRRVPSLADPRWIAKIEDRLQQTVLAQRAYHPLFYNLADEAGIADLSAYWDFDFSDPSLAAFRVWLKSRYGDVGALNRQWGSRFSRWRDVVPETTRQAIARTDNNYSAWADFKAWMDLSFARAIALGTKAVHDADPAALAGLEGGQVPGWGGYDYSLLATTVDVMEPDDDNLALVHSLNPDLVLLTVAFGSDETQRADTWRAVLDGARGLILWDGKERSVDDDGHLTARGTGLAPLFAELRGGIGAALIASRTQYDPVAILYSQASMRTQWMLDWRSKDEQWSRRDADAENQANGWRTALGNAVRAVTDAQLTPCYVTSAMVERGALRDGKIRLLILPHAIALSRREVDAIRAFADRGGTVLADSVPGLFDEHSRARAKPPLDDIIAPDDRVAAFDGRALAHALRQAHVEPPVRLVSASGAPVAGIELHRFSNGRVTIVALPPRRRGGAALSAPLALELPGEAFVYDMRGERELGRMRRVPVALDPEAPVLLALSPKRLAPPAVTGPAQIRLGASGAVHIAVANGAAADVLHVDVIDPAGQTVAADSDNIVAHGGGASFRLALKSHDEAGPWQLRILDILSGKDVVKEILAVPP